MTARNVKEQIKLLAKAQGFHRVSIGSLEPLDEARLKYEAWLSNGFAAGMEYLKRNTVLRSSPALLYPGSLSAIVVAISYYSHVPDRAQFPFAGRVARYAVGLDYHAVIRARLRELRASIEKEIGRPLLAKAYTDDVALLEQAFASRHGIGFAGRHTLVIGPKLDGSYYFLAELFTDIELEADGPYTGTCGSCFRCGNACPTGAIKPDGHLDANLCISYLTIENRAGIPVELRASLGKWVFGCDICQEVCPYNQRPPESVWDEFRPEKGVGHYLDLASLLTIRDDEEFSRRFGHTPLRRPKRRGLLRNAAVVIGNTLKELRERSSLQRDERLWSEAVTDRLHELVKREPDPMLREHAFWALSLSPVASKSLLDRIVRDERSIEASSLMTSYLGD